MVLSKLSNSVRDNKVQQSGKLAQWHPLPSFGLGPSSGSDRFGTYVTEWRVDELHLEARLSGSVAFSIEFPTAYVTVTVPAAARHVHSGVRNTYCTVELSYCPQRNRTTGSVIFTFPFGSNTNFYWH